MKKEIFTNDLRQKRKSQKKKQRKKIEINSMEKCKKKRLTSLSVNKM